MHLQPNGTSRAPNGALGTPKHKTVYPTVHRGFKELYNPQKYIGAGSAIDVDIVFVPGLGAHPEDCWKSETGFNWVTGVHDGTRKLTSEPSNKNGLARDFPKARMLLYQYDSARVKDLKVKSFMRDIAESMLEGLQANREGIRDRPIVFIGHGIGGLVIAKAITIAADSHRALFPRMLESIASCAFFGTPFGGAHVAAVASMLGDFGEHLGYTKSLALANTMTPGNESLSDLRNELLVAALNLNPAVQLFCFYESQHTDLAEKRYGGAAMSKVAKAVASQKFQDFVPKESATLQGIEHMGLDANHRNLVKFSDFKDSQYQLVREPLKRLIQGASLVVKNRLKSMRGINQELVGSVMDILNGGQVSKKRKLMALQFPPSTWIPKETEYLEWFEDHHETEAMRQHQGRVLFIRGLEGRGKMRATLAALQDVDKAIQMDEKESCGRPSTLVAYFFCDTSPSFSTAEDLLKSLIRQLIVQQPTLAVYAKRFVKKSEAFPGMQAALTVENLWQALQDMLMDESIGRRVYFIISNLHHLRKDADSTIKLMQSLCEEAQVLKTDDERRVTPSWFMTSREFQHIEESLMGESIRLIDLESDKYCDQVELELRKTAQEKVQEVGRAKKYNKALTYFASSLIAKRASTSQWIKFSCLQLAGLPETRSDHKIRHTLESLPTQLSELLDATWFQIFNASEKEADKIKEMLRALFLAFEDPTEEELCVLTGFCATREGKAELRGLVKRCRPLLVVRRNGESENVVGFADRTVKDHLLEVETLKKTLGMSGDEIKWQHGMMALRCLAHIKERYDFPPVEKGFEGCTGPSARAATKDNKQGDDGEAIEAKKQGRGDDDASMSESQHTIEDTNWDDDDSIFNYDMDMEDAEIDEARSLLGKAGAYAVKHWLRHASEATVEIAEDLSEDDFWQIESLIRHQWLLVYMHTTKTLAGFSGKNLTALHIAAATGFKQLVSALIHGGHGGEINHRNELGYTPLHLAAHIGHADIVDELLERNANVDDGIELRKQTPLHMAAFAGHVGIMNMLIQQGASPKAIADDVGPVINAAISSGNLDAVKLLVELDVPLTIENDGGYSPLALAGLHAGLPMFEYLMKKYADKLPPDEFDKAFINAAVSGRVEVFNALLRYPHSQACFQDALGAATEAGNWSIATIILEQRENLECNELFLEAASTVRHQDNMLEAVWKYTDGNISTRVLKKSLCYATDLEKESTVRLLLETFNVNPNAPSKQFGTALTAAAYNGNLDLVKLFLGKGAEMNISNGWPLQAAAAAGHYNVVEELLSRGAYVNAFIENRHFTQGTALQAACESGNVEIATLLLEHGANPDLGAGEHTCPIMAAAMRGDQTMLELLVNAKAEVDIFGGRHNSTVLIKAVVNLPLEALRVLLDAGADVNLENKKGNTPLIVAAREGDADCVRFLLNNGADIFHTNNDNENALQAAIRYGRNDDCTAVLIERISGIMSALRKAVKNGNTAVSKVIRSVGPGQQSLTYDDWEDPPHHDDDRTSTVYEASDEEDGNLGTGTPRTESIPNSARKVDRYTASERSTPVSLQPRSSEKLCDDFEAAIAAQVSMLQRLGSPRPSSRPRTLPEEEEQLLVVESPPTTIAELPSQRRYSQQVQLQETMLQYEFDQLSSPYLAQPKTTTSLQWANRIEGLSIASDPALVPSQASSVCRRRPTPSVVYSTSYARNASPAPPIDSEGRHPLLVAWRSGSPGQGLSPAPAPPPPPTPKKLQTSRDPIIRLSPQSVDSSETQESRSDVKSHRSSFLGMKNTFGRAKQFSTGIMNRRASGF